MFPSPDSAALFRRGIATFADFADVSSAILLTLPREAGTLKVACVGDCATGVYGVRGVATRGGTLDISVDLSVAGVDLEDSFCRAVGAEMGIDEDLLIVSSALVPATPGRDADLRGGGGGSDMVKDQKHRMFLTIFPAEQYSD